jgi:hypothetical protein
LPNHWAQWVYTCFWVALWPLCAWSFAWNADAGASRVDEVAGVSTETLVALVLVYGPLFLAWALCRLTRDSLPWRWPFHKEAILDQFGLFALLGQVVVLMPVFHAAKWAGAARQV